MSIALLVIIVAFILAVLAALKLPRWETLLSVSVVLVCIVLLVSNFTR